VVIVNGAEAPIDVNANGTFQTIAILRPGTNTISVRAVNAQGSSVSQPLTVNYTPAAGTNFLFRATLTWDGPGDIDLHVFDPNNAHAYYGNEEIATGELDVDNTEAVGPENFSLRTATPGRYKIAVNSYSGGEGRRATLRVTINSGPSAGPELRLRPVHLRRLQRRRGLSRDGQHRVLVASRGRDRERERHDHGGGTGHKHPVVAQPIGACRFEEKVSPATCVRTRTHRCDGYPGRQ
jgi:hypothetical protein